ncbi:MAG: lectin like domain-containing protein, partial [Ruminococcus sp.]
MNLFFKIFSVLSLPAVIASSVQNDNTVSFQTNINNNVNAEFDMEFDTSESGFIPIDISDTSDSTSESSFPESFDLRDSGQVQNVKDQGEYNTCWTQASVDSAESSIIKRVPDINLSEWHLAYYAHSGGEQIDLGEDSRTEKIFKHGGSPSIAANMWSQWKGPVTEKKEIEYGSYDIITDTELQEKYYDSADYHLKNAYIFDIKGNNPELRNKTLKEFLLKGQAIDIAYYSDSSFYDNLHNSYMSGQNKNANHDVTIIGYDDNFPAENFSSDTLPENNGAWLVKNSWGNTWQDNGFFWISYEEPSMCQFTVFEIEDSNNYTKNYHHDTFLSNNVFMKSGSGNTSYMANVFQSESNEWLQAVSCYFRVADTDYQIDIYKNLKSSSNPTSGEKAYSISGKNSITGYQTIEFDQNIELSEGEYFSVVITMTNSNNSYLIPAETSASVTNPDTGKIIDLYENVRYEQIKEYTHKNESFISSNGTQWTDLADT